MKTWTQKGIVESILALEIKFNLLDGRSQHSAVWERLRFVVYRELMQMLGLEKPPIFKPSLRGQPIWRILRTALEMGKNILLNTPGRGSARPYLFYCNPRRRRNQHNRFEDIWSDPMMRLVGADESIGIENPVDFRHYVPAQTKHLYFTDVLLVLAVIITKAYSVFGRRIDTAIFRQVEQELHEVFSVRVSIAGAARNTHCRRVAWIMVFRSLFRRLAPKIIFLVCSYGKEDIVEAAKGIGIPTIELQHGVITPLHLGYSFPGPRLKRSFPDYMFSFGDHWPQTVEFPIPSGRILNVGFPFLNQALKTNVGIQKCDQIIFLSQGTTGEQIASVAVRFAEKNPTVRVVYKLHPGEFGRWEKQYLGLKAASDRGALTVVEGSSTTLYELLAESRWQVGVNSTAIFEGIAFNCVTFILKCPGYEYMDGLLATGAATLIVDEDGLILDTPTARRVDADSFFRRDVETGVKNAMSLVNV